MNQKYFSKQYQQKQGDKVDTLFCRCVFNVLDILICLAILKDYIEGYEPIYIEIYRLVVQ